MQPFLQWLESTPGSVAIRESILFYPVIETTHVLSICLFVGMISMLDLRLIGAALRGVPVSETASRFLPYALTGFAIMVVSGILLFYSGPLKAFNNIFFKVKMALIVLAGINAGLFHVTIFKRVNEWDLDPAPPGRARLAGYLSLIFWSGVIVCGRMQAYKWFE